MHAILRRVGRSTESGSGGGAIRLGGVELDPPTRRVWREGEPVHLTPTEFDILALLAARPGVVFTRERLLAEVWGYRDGFGARTVDSHVQALRRKLGAETVRTVHGVGYAAGDHPEAPVARGPELERLACHHDLATVTIEDLVAYRRAERRLVARGSHFVPACPF